FEERLEELRALQVHARDCRTIRLRQREEEVVVAALGVAERRLRVHVDGLVLGTGPVLSRAHVDAQLAARAVLRRDLDRVQAGRVLLALVRGRLEGGWRPGARALVVYLRANGGVWAHHRALVALDADLRVPY